MHFCSLPPRSPPVIYSGPPDFPPVLHRMQADTQPAAPSPAGRFNSLHVTRIRNAYAKSSKAEGTQLPGGNGEWGAAAARSGGGHLHNTCHRSRCRPVSQHRRNPKNKHKLHSQFSSFTLSPCCSRLVDHGLTQGEKTTFKTPGRVKP